MAVRDKDMPVAKSSIVLREEFDEWAVLFDPDTGNVFGLNPVGVFIWKHLDGLRTIQDMLRELCENCEDVPEEAGDHLKDFIQGLVDKGFAEYEN